jgi:hypothetical protein
VDVELGSALNPTGKSKAPLIAGGVVLVLGLAVGVALALHTTSKPQEPRVAPLVTPKPTPRPVPPAPKSSPEVLFDVQTEPPGATVTRDGNVLGQTPLAVKIIRDSDAPAQVELGLSLDGYEPATVMAQGMTGAVPVRQTLKKKAPTPPPAPTKAGKPPKPGKKDPNADGYKDDPYQ